MDVKQRKGPSQCDVLSGSCYGCTFVVPQNSGLCDGRRLLQSTLARGVRLRFRPRDRSPNLIRIFFLANLGESIFDTTDGGAAAADALSTATRSDQVGVRLRQSSATGERLWCLHTFALLFKDPVGVVALRHCSCSNGQKL